MQETFYRVRFQYGLILIMMKIIFNILKLIDIIVKLGSNNTIALF